MDLLPNYKNILNQHEIPEGYGKGHLSSALKTFN